jgi:hypothetical protein
VGDESSLHSADPLHERQEPALKQQIQHTARWPPGKRHWALLKAFFLLSCPDPGPGPGICAPQTAAAREGEAPLERVLRHLPRSRLRYFAAVQPVLPVRIMSLTCGAKGAKGTRAPDPLLANNRQHVHPSARRTGYNDAATPAGGE